MTGLFWRAAQFVLVVVCTTVSVGASDSDFGFLWICSVRAAAHRGAPQKFIRGVVIGVHQSLDKSDRESFTMTDDSGYAMIPLRPGNYCAGGAPLEF